MTALGAPLLLLSLAAAAPPKKAEVMDYEARLNDRLGKGITPERNAAVLLWKAVGPTPGGGSRMPDGYFQRLRIPEPPKTGAYFIKLSAYLHDQKLPQADITTAYDQLLRASQRPWAAKDFPRIAAWLKLNEGPLATVAEAVRRPDYYHPLISRKDKKDPGSLIDSLSDVLLRYGGLASALTARAMLRAGEGKFDGARADLLTCHRLGRQVGRGGTLIEGLVGIATEQVAITAELAYLDRADLSTEQIRARLKDLDGLLSPASTADQIDLGERSMYYESFGVLPQRGLSKLDAILRWDFGSVKGPTPEESKALAAIDWGPAIMLGDQWYDRIVAAVRLKTRAERRRALDALGTELAGLTKKAGSLPGVLKDILTKKDAGQTAGTRIGVILIAAALDSIRRVQDAQDRIEQVRRNLRVAFALAAYRADRGRYPGQLADLAPKYLAVVPDDLFADKPLIYRPAPKGYLLYSVGVNGKDDGGRWIYDDPPGDDPCVRMPPPEMKSK